MQSELTGLQLEVMRVLWDRGQATVAEVQEALLPERSLAYSTLATILSRLEDKRQVCHEVRGRTFVYKPLLAEEDASQSMLSRLVEGVFGGSPAELVSQLLQSQDVDAEELQRIKELVQRHVAARRRGEKGDHRDR
jgi:BlaI family penicillinase repressor